MTATQQDSVAVLLELAGSLGRASPYGPAIEVAIQSLQSQQGASADRGEAVEKGPWFAIHERGKWLLQSEDFTHDARLYINGDFASDAQEQAYAELIAARLNATPPSPAESAEGNNWIDAGVLTSQLEGYAEPNCRECDGSGVYYGNVCICNCILDALPKHDPAAPSGVSGAVELDPQLATFYQVDSVPALLLALEEHVVKLQDTVRRNVKPWEDTFPPTLLPKYLRESGLAAQPGMAKALRDLLAAASLSAATGTPFAADSPAIVNARAALEAAQPQPGRVEGMVLGLYAAAGKGFHVSETCGPDGKYWHISKFQSLADLQAYEQTWREVMLAAKGATP